ncbi:MAG: C45 family autoproteolytic acyltransferase/hydrolase, partial [bacterium]|nr:C45 family autoproteolytic acyltransferase/hydrolase [bacterium]MDW8163377.1 C45 family autoproteolytic acyltransferase/hydrolase [Candidatus Omnitrophota bacterium]
MDLNVIEIKGSYFETGFLLGKCHKKILKNIEEGVKEIKVDLEKIKKYESCLNKVPEIREEIEGYCEGGEIKFENFLKLKFIDYIFPKLSCTSIYLSSEFVEDKIPVVMKIRDKLPMPQYICKKLNGNRIPYFFSGSISEIGFAFFVKENGLTGINNTGSYMKENFVNEIGFDDCDIMRIIAEYCDDLENIIEIIKKFQKDKMVGCAGKRRGMIFLFAKNEEAILVETNSFNINWKKVKGKLGFTNDFLMKDSQDWIEKLDTEGVKSSLNRKKRIDEILDENDLFNIKKLIRISRDKKYYPYSICRDTKLMPIRTISAYFVYLFPQPIVWITCGSPYVSPFFPFFIK